MMEINTAKLSEELRKSLKKAERGRKLVVLFKIPMYFLALLYVCFVMSSPFLGGIYGKFFVQDIMMKIIVPIAIIIAIASYGFTKSLAYFINMENNIIIKIIKKLFPTAKYREVGYGVIKYQTLQDSKLFPKLGGTNNLPATTTYGSLTLKTKTGELNVVDIGISYGAANHIMSSNSIMAYFMLIYKTLFKPLVNSRVDSALFNFRGMFTWAKLKKELKADILILPDHLEDKLGYLAQNIQAIKMFDKNNKLVKMEDVEFEKKFAVYSNDEVAARYILTPLMMRRIIELRNKFNRDIMISFSGKGFYIAVHMPDGFLALRGKELDNKNIVEEIYYDIKTSMEIFDNLSLKL